MRRYVHREHYRIDDSHATVSGIDHAGKLDYLGVSSSN